MIKQNFLAQLKSTKFVYVEEAFLAAIGGSIAKTIWTAFPYTELLGFLTLFVGAVYGIRSWAETRENKNGNSNDTSTSKLEGYLDKV
jgi:hypothetical protein